MSSYRLRQELLKDPDAEGYAAMTDAQVLARITDESLRFLPDRDTLSSSEIYEAIVRTEYRALAASEKSELGIILGLGNSIDITAGSKARSALAAMFGVSATATALLKMVEGRKQSIAQQLSINSNSLTLKGIAAARIPDQPEGVK